eukprot:GAHX01005924.1.p1 GENE.GAHX01005924.1~~GAHX01005924.1.p1  ORF type:complete len:58 (-),score=4.87 GAHX01005924.1:226-399(-)
MGGLVPKIDPPNIPVFPNFPPQHPVGPTPQPDPPPPPVAPCEDKLHPTITDKKNWKF